MSDLGSDIASLLVRELHGVQRELDLFPGETIWATVPGVSNSAGNLTLHLAGNLRHFIGATLGKTTYVRNRTAEFVRRSGTKIELTSEIQEAIAVVLDVLPGLPDDVLSLDYPQALGTSRPLTTRAFLLHLCAHTAYHLGQIGYLRRMITGQNQPGGTVSLESLS